MPEELKTLVRNTWQGGAGEFRPCAFFDDRLDCIRVIARDCSVLEERINDRLTVLLDNHHVHRQGSGKYVGFTVKGARHFCDEHGWDTAASITVRQLIDAILASSPEVVVEWFVDVVARPLVEMGKIEQVEIPLPATLQPA
jgi:hypothetical protein